VDLKPFPTLVRFGAFELDLRARELRKGGLSTGVPEQSIKILALLLETPGQIVLRDEMRKRLWPNDTVVEFDHSINAAIKRLRQALGDPAEAPQYIETLARRGYRWKCPVELVETPQAAVPTHVEDVQSGTAAGGNLIGKKVSHYRVLEVLGGGGMGVVFKGEDLKLGRRVALKFLPEETAKDALALHRFEQEARAASALNHPNICTIYGIEEHEGQPFIVMELLEGETLRELISAAKTRTAPLPLEKLLDLAVQITEGLDAAHQKGIIHRDIKPANVFVTTQGLAKILDFGLAKLLREPVTAEIYPGHEHRADDVHGTLGETVLIPASDLSLSRTGVVMGTAGYMSPEQVRGEKLDARTDLFSFGLVLYEMASGQRAFTGETTPILHDAILSHTPMPVRELNPELPSRLEEIIQKALEKDREVRYQTASEIRSDLERLRRDLELTLLGTLGRKMAVVVAALFVAGVIFWFANRQMSSSHAVPDLKLRQLTINSPENRVTSGAISPDGKYLAYTDTKGMYIKLIETGEIRAVHEPTALKREGVGWEAGLWFPDSTKFLANAHPPLQSTDDWSSRDTSIWMVSVLGEVPRKLRDNARAYSVSPDGSLLSFGTNTGRRGPREIWLMGSDGEQARKLYGANEDSAIFGLTWSPDRQRVIYTMIDESGSTLVSRDLKDGPVATLLPPSETKKMGDFSWLPDGRSIYSDPCLGVNSAFDTPCNYWIERMDTRTGELIDKPRRLTNSAGVCMSDSSTTADGKRVVFLESSGRGTSYVADLEADGTRLVNSRPFTLEEGGEDVIDDWTADSKTAILMLNRGDHYGLYKQRLNSNTAEPIVASVAGGLLENAQVSPDGKWVIIQVWPITGGATVQLMRVPITGGTPELIFPVREGSMSFCARPPSNLCAVAEQGDDHKQMIITSFDPVKGRGLELARFELDSDYDMNANYLLWNISRDGTRLAAARGPEGPIQVRSLRGQPTQVIRAKGLNNMWRLKWAADGRGLFVSNREKGGAEILHVDLQGNAKLLWKCSGDRCVGRPSPDGRHLAIYDWKQSANMWMMENF
jgi:eukaryotic-like serine/threonine-protein kinase